ncbi:hypothetical protein PVA44_07710 (plasmid) [Entomospira nematocerorum]|uniref:Uncharacterized protein n=1 Tax=Entomospira nematocerorum TaxID=2719987 RepID=A0A968GE24_9SPIO|nr:hypothetical protein [Entomospira nematocera]NIZ47798.1 hypothetical protein [Entomospira nematocera]WDI34776.1 hypothetical protein PVA44_07710 [Entomospira nematocera]
MAFKQDPFLRDSMHRETMESLEKGHYYYPAMVLIRSSSGALHPASLEDIGSHTQFFISIAETNLIDATNNVSMPVLLSGSVWATSLRLPSEATLTTKTNGKLIFDQLIGSRIIPVSHDFTMYHAGLNTQESPEPKGEA